MSYDFAGFVTKNDIECADGVTIRRDTFKDNHGETVPLVWNHDYNNPSNVLGHVRLENTPNGVYGYGYFNETPEAIHAKEMVKHGDVNAMSIGARKIKRNGRDVVHGKIYEVSLVLSGANPGAMIESVMTHSAEGDVESAIIYTGTFIHSADDILPEKETITHSEVQKEEAMAENKEKQEKTIGQIIDDMTEEQKEAVYALVGIAVENAADDEDDEDDNEEGDDEVKQNAFYGNEPGNNGEILRHGMNEVLTNAIRSGASSLKQAMDTYMEDTIQHGINSIEMLFPEADHSTNGSEPILYKDPNTGADKILNAMTKSPFSKVRTLVADLTESEARAKGYIKGTMKKEEYFSLIKRSTSPTTIYKKQKIDRDDLVDITDFNVVSFMNREMRYMLKEEIARAALVGDGRDVADDDKISEENIRPIITDHEFFTIQKQFTSASDFVEKFIKAMPEYRGSGNPTMYIDPVLLADIKLLKGTDGRFLYGDIPSTAAIATRLGVSEIVETTFMSGKGALVVNPRDYTLGATKGGEITNFDDFDIDFNQYKYLIETRLSGALTMPKSAIHFATTVVVGAGDAAGGVTYGDRMADKVVEPDPEG